MATGGLRTALFGAQRRQTRSKNRKWRKLGPEMAKNLGRKWPRERELWFGTDLLGGGGVLVRVELELVVEGDRPQLRVRPEVHLDLDILTRKSHFSGTTFLCATFHFDEP